MHEPRITGVVVLSLMCTAHAVAGVQTVGLELVADTLSAPNLLTSPNDGTGRLFVVDQIGQIRIIDSDGALLPTPFLDLSSKMVPLGAFGPGSFDERGLLGLAFHPSFATNDTFYVYYSAPRAPDTIISFDEADIANGVSNFEFRGIGFSGAIAGTQFFPPLYCTGAVLVHRFLRYARLNVTPFLASDCATFCVPWSKPHQYHVRNIESPYVQIARASL